jgi:hypothetical protein
MLCQVCHEIFRGVFATAYYVKHHDSYQSLRDSAKEGCYVCVILWRSISPVLPDHPAALDYVPEATEGQEALAFKSFRTSLEQRDGEVDEEGLLFIGFEIDYGRIQSYRASFFLQGISGMSRTIYVRRSADTSYRKCC